MKGDVSYWTCDRCTKVIDQVALWSGRPLMIWDNIGYRWSTRFVPVCAECA